jgi:hypothetical protein
VDPIEHNEEEDILFDSGSFVDANCRPESGSENWADPLLLSPGSGEAVAPESPGRENRPPSVSPPMPRDPVILCMLSDAIDRPRASLARLLVDGGRGMEMLAFAMLPVLVSGAAYGAFLLMGDETLEAEDKLCVAVRDLIRGDGGVRRGIFTGADDEGADDDGAKKAVLLLGGELAAWLVLAWPGVCVKDAGSTMGGLSIARTAYKTSRYCHKTLSRRLLSNTCPLRALCANRLAWPQQQSLKAVSHMMSNGRARSGKAKYRRGKLPSPLCARLSLDTQSRNGGFPLLFFLRGRAV